MSTAGDLAFKDENHLKSREGEDITASQIWASRRLRNRLCAVTNHSNMLMGGLRLLWSALIWRLICKWLWEQQECPVIAMTFTFRRASGEQWKRMTRISLLASVQGWTYKLTPKRAANAYRLLVLLPASGSNLHWFWKPSLVCTWDTQNHYMVTLFIAILPHLLLSGRTYICMFINSVNRHLCWGQNWFSFIIELFSLYQ